MKKLDLRKKVLNKYYDKAMNNVFTYSANYLMNTPKKGFEREFEEACIEAEVFEEMIKELTHEATEEEFDME